MSVIPPDPDPTALDSLDDASLCWLESLSLDKMDAEVRARWTGVVEPGAPATIEAPPIRKSQIGQVSQVRGGAQAAPDAQSAERQQRVAIRELVYSYRQHGHLAADLDPLGMQHRERPECLFPATFGLDQLAPETVVQAEGFTGAAGRSLPFGELLQALERIYCDSMAINLSGLLDIHLQQSDGESPALWLAERLESHAFEPEAPVAERTQLLQRLIAAEELERYLGRRYPGAKRFGLEGGEALIPLIDSLVEAAAGQGAQEICIGMAHRGRLNVLVNVFGKPTSELFAEFEGTAELSTETGDVKYHQGFSSNLTLPDGDKVHLALAFNPSHLEAVGAVVIGSVRARQDRYASLAKLRDEVGEAIPSRDRVVAIEVHGDAAFSGQGVVMETFQMSETPAYSTGGTVHIVVNNQIGYTTSNPRDARSTRYCTDVARVVEAPVLHINADDPEAVIFAASLAMEYRHKFGTDIVLDLVCFRRFGHNEADEPAATQPLMYQVVRDHPGVRSKYAANLDAAGLCSTAESDAMSEDYRQKLEAGEVVATLPVTRTEPDDMFDWTPYLRGTNDADANQDTDTAVGADLVEELAPMLTAVPDDFRLQRQVERLMATRSDMLAGNQSLDWGCAEILAYGSLLRQGYPIRCSGQDSRRGTFAHRHLTLFDQQTGREFTPLAQVAELGGTSLSFYDSLLSEEAVLAFEYGYSATWPTGLVAWEAQFGDFANGAQIIIDQFIVSGEQKWHRLSGLVLLLPHGHEGQGPEHSSARLERFLQLCARDNIQLCVPSTPAQHFHLMRRQVLRPLRRPLVVMAPKSLLRLPEAASPMAEFTGGGFQRVLDDGSVDPAAVTRVVLCSGRLYYALNRLRQSEGLRHLAIVRLEQIYPFPYKELEQIMRRYNAADTLVWCQEDPANQGGWHQLQHRFYSVTGNLDREVFVQPVTRESAAAPAVGWAGLHERQEELLLRQALGLDGDS